MSKAIIASACVVLLSAPNVQAGLLSVPKDYRPDKSWPVIVSLQDNPSKEQMATVPYFMVHAGGQAAELTTKIRNELKSVARRYNIDPFRIYGTGFSRGGHEVLAQAWQHPHWFAAIAPVCNDLRREPKVFNVRYLVHTPTLLLHGQGDSFRRTGQVLFGYMKEAGCNVRFQTYPGGHTPQQPFKQNVRMLTDFFDKHVLDPYPRQVVHLVSHKRYSRAFWVDSTLVKDAGGLKEVFKVKVVKGNRIEVEVTDQIASLDLYLTGQLVDMKKPVTVVRSGPSPAEAGGVQLYHGPAKAKLTVTFREGKPYYQARQKPLWEQIRQIRAEVNAAASRPAATKPGE